MNFPPLGRTAPDFTAKDQDGQVIDLGEFIGQKNVVLYFYPKDDTPGCTLEAQEFTRDKPQFDALDTEILGVSIDDAASHKAFCDKFGLAFRLVADPDKSIARTYGVLGDHGLANRVTFLIGRDGTLRKVYAEVKPRGHSAQVLADLKTL